MWFYGFRNAARVLETSFDRLSTFVHHLCDKFQGARNRLELLCLQTVPGTFSPPCLQTVPGTFSPHPSILGRLAGLKLPSLILRSLSFSVSASLRASASTGAVFLELSCFSLSRVLRLVIRPSALSAWVVVERRVLGSDRVSGFFHRSEQAGSLRESLAHMLVAGENRLALAVLGCLFDDLGHPFGVLLEHPDLQFQLSPSFLQLVAVALDVLGQLVSLINQCIDTPTHGNLLSIVCGRTVNLAGCRDYD